jgi:8-oxo-dGTP pyrophosphatase MutT (NUDIX family)
VLLVRNGRIALIERRRNGEHYYVAPGGGIELGESAEDAAVREAREELGIDVRLLGHALTVESTARGRSRQHYWHAETDAEDFGPTAGPERTTASNSYVRVWVAVADLDGLDLRPDELRAAVRR